jgi:all-trans-retinol dehydrogenase (NAD+)
MAPSTTVENIAKALFSRDGTIAAVAVIGLLSLRQLSSWASRRALNNYVTDRTWDWTIEIVLLTGGSSGIGAATAKILAEKGVKVIIVDLHPPKHTLCMSRALTAHFTLLMRIAPNQFFYKLDITSSEEIKAVAQQIRAEHGDPTVLINNAGIADAKPILDLPEPRMRKVFEVNIVAHFLLLSEFLPSMIRKNHGHVVTLASMASFSTQASNVGYCASKAAALSLHEGLGQELKHVYHAPKVRTT